MPIVAVILEGIDLLVSAFSRVIGTRLGSWLVQAMLFFGIQWAANSFVAAPIKSGLSAAFGGLTADTLAWIGYLNIDRCLTLMLSAYAAASLTKMSFQKKAAS